MKFLLVVLAIRFLFELLSRKNIEKKENKIEVNDWTKVIHPAEEQLR